jgi:hypothetical protein
MGGKNWLYDQRTVLQPSLGHLRGAYATEVGGAVGGCRGAWLRNLCWRGFLMKRSGFNPRKSSLQRSPFKVADKPTQMRRSGIKSKGKKAATAAEREHMGIVAGLFCVVCRNLRLGESPAEVHHVRYSAGGGQKSGNLETIPLCPNHHRLGGFGVAIHAGRKTWETIYGTEHDLLDQTKRETGLIEQPQLEEA